MPNSTLDTSKLSDALVSVADDIRRALHGELGTHPYKVAIVTRRWSGLRVGVGTFEDTILELDPQPTFRKSSGYRAGPGGFEKRYDAVVTGLSLTYTESELWQKGGGNTEVVWVVEEAQGQGQETEFYTISNLTPRRGDLPGDDIDWRAELSTVQPLTPWDGIPA